MTSRRVTEPFLKAHLALWLAEHGATSIAISVDGAEPQAREVREILCGSGCTFEKTSDSRTVYAGSYVRPGLAVVVNARPGIDVRATFDDGRELLAECKGEKTAAGIRSGTDLTAVAEVIGQLLLGAGDLGGDALLALVLPRTDRVVGFARRVAANRFLSRLPVYVLVVDGSGGVSGVGPQLPLGTAS